MCLPSLYCRRVPSPCPAQLQTPVHGGGGRAAGQLHVHVWFYLTFVSAAFAAHVYSQVIMPVFLPYPWPFTCCVPSPVLPSYRPQSTAREDERLASSVFMAVDGRHIAFTPRDDLRYKTVTLPGASSDYRMAPLVLQDDDNRPVKTWTHIIPGAVDEGQNSDPHSEGQNK